MKTPRIRERKLGRERALGMTTEGIPEIIIDPRQSSKERLDTTVHEALHQADPTMAERDVARIARLVARVLWRDKWRRVQ
jgi:hypothetical protein